ncbi:hypothetical protein SERLA73DRAFT_187212 [Serpula lacrymans var. lacrymans S7.3]|uniref:Transmembrane protein 135 N-terminal domain-containing protein n=2 Tax=Serpula lacrymans var. lacrymans TaxID=341189 RepID=F8Q8P0_SERL3|nr:uncharacterized protein SERLADRAFT_476636 [Serpula lacrymans var. lacrymans S7.9]EGN94945.1 hypothetical protein SERLA73DRAFT_187212 [Serpula lacrymans var. lacrymans S7.3]EGO20438.1 hypothetical protein SERLADRAFT_476636 [Serpula lacrymans var. lacrymans S7.9]
MSSTESSPDPPLQRTPSYIQFTPRHAMASFENLVALANHQERLREARKMVWRDRGEPAVELEDLWECIEHAGRGGMRAGAIAFAIRASVNLVLATIRMGRVPKHMRIALIRHAIFGQDSFRFAAMLGSFVSLYKALLNAFPIIFPVSKMQSTLRPSPFDDEGDMLEDDDAMEHTLKVPLAQRQARLSLTAQVHQIWVHKKTRRWHSLLAGAVAGGLAVMFEKRSRRIVIAQQLFVRGLQGSYNAFSSKRGINLPHGDVIVFSLCSAQIVYAFFSRPDTLPRSYIAWLTTASGAPAEAIRMVRDINRTSKFDVGDLKNILQREDLIPANRSVVLDSMQLASAPVPNYGTPYPPCAAVHPWVASCTRVPLPRFLAVFKWAFPIYGALHFVPMILFKRHQFLKNPLHMLTRAGWGTMRSSAFLSTFVAFFQFWFCFKHWLHAVLSTQTIVKIPQGVIDFLVSRYSFGLGGFLGALSLFVEEKRRRGELAMYVLPKGLESAWLTARGKGWVFKTGESGVVLLTAMGMGMVMSIYQHDPHHLSGLVRRILYQFIGAN